MALGAVVLCSLRSARGWALWRAGHAAVGMGMQRDGATLVSLFRGLGMCRCLSGMRFVLRADTC